MKKIVIRNPKVRHDFEIIDEYEAGIELKGSEVKSLRLSKGNIKGAFGLFKGNELYLYNFHISPYQMSSPYKTIPDRPKKLLLHRHQLKRIYGAITQKGFSIVPTDVYFNNRGIAKVTIALVKPLRKYDKREILRRRDIEREIRKEIKGL